MRARGVGLRRAGVVPRAWRRAAGTAALLLATALVAGCSGQTEVPVAPGPPPVPELTFQELREAPLDLKFNGIAFTVDVALWRDFMPPAPEDGRPLAARAVVTAENEDAYPPTVTAAYVWVVNGGVFWASRMKEAGSPAGIPNAMIYLADGGPLWGPNVVVDVVVGLRTEGSVLHLVRIPGILIARTD